MDMLLEFGSWRWDGYIKISNVQKKKKSNVLALVGEKIRVMASEKTLCFRYGDFSRERYLPRIIPNWNSEYILQ